MSASRLRISRDTRWLLVIVAVSVAALSVLARVRFRDDARLAGPIAPVLSQLGPRSPFEGMTAAVEGVLPRLRAVVTPLALPAIAGASAGETVVPAVTFADGFVAALAPTRTRPSAAAVAAFDRSTRLAVARLPDARVSATLQTWAPIAAPQPRFFVAVETPSGEVVARPVFVAAMTSTASPGWPSPSWLLPGAPPMAPGTMLFTLEGALAGVIVRHDSQQALVPWPVVASEAQRLLTTGDAAAGYLDIDVQVLTEPLRAATRSQQGVLVSWVAPSGAAAGLVKVGDVIAGVDGQAVASVADWEPRIDRLSAGQSVTLDVWRGDAAVAVPVVARGEPAPAALLGLRLRTVAGAGARIERVADGSAGQRAGLRAGDLLTRVGDVDVPTEAEARRAFDTATADRPLLVAVTRGDVHFVLAMDRDW